MTPRNCPAHFWFPVLDRIEVQRLDRREQYQPRHVAKGAQLSADAIAQLQGASAANIKMKQNLLEQAEKEFGFQLQWNIRQACDDPVSVQLNDPASGDSINLAGIPAMTNQTMA